MHIIFPLWAIMHQWRFRRSNVIKGLMIGLYPLQLCVMISSSPTGHFSWNSIPNCVSDISSTSIEPGYVEDPDAQTYFNNQLFEIGNTKLQHMTEWDDGDQFDHQAICKGQLRTIFLFNC